MRLRKKKSPPIANLIAAFAGGAAFGGAVVGAVAALLSPSRRSRREDVSQREESRSDAQGSEPLGSVAVHSDSEPDSQSSRRARVHHS